MAPIHLALGKDQIRKAAEFAEGSVSETYQRLPTEFQEPAEHEQQLRERIRRIRVGKLGEIAFSQHLRNAGKDPQDENMFEIFQGTTNVDPFDFQTQRRESIDIKTASRKSHKRIIIPVDQFDNNPKDFYVGVRVIEKSESLVEASIYGYVEKNEITESDIDFRGKGHGYEKMLQSLRPIGELVSRMP